MEREQMYIKRILDLSNRISLQSQFLFGARQTGKSSYLLHQIKNSIKLNIDLLDSRKRMRYTKDPALLSDEVRALDGDEGIVVIDEIQLVPDLLNEIHNIIETTGFRFILTGSSARRLKNAHVNMLGGRAGKCIFHPLVWPEIKDIDFSLEHIFKTGLLPAIYLSKESDKLLSSYWSTYLVDEVCSEGYVRNLLPFSNFVEMAALSSGEIINYSNIASDLGRSKNTIREWYSILSDMLIGYELPVYGNGRKRKAIDKSKYYFFDVGVLRSILGMPVPNENMSEFGKFFEHYIAHELISYIDYKGDEEKRRNLYYWRTTTGLEVDFIYLPQVAIEVKSYRQINEKKDLKGLRALMDEFVCTEYIVVCREEYKRKTEDGIYIYPYKQFLEELWDGKIIEL